MTTVSPRVLAARVDDLIEGVIEAARDHHRPARNLALPLQRPAIPANPDPRAPYGLRGHGGPPTLSATEHIIRVPVPPEDIIRSC